MYIVCTGKSFLKQRSQLIGFFREHLLHWTRHDLGLDIDCFWFFFIVYGVRSQSLLYFFVFFKAGGRTEPAASDSGSSTTSAGPTEEVIARLIQGISTQLTQAAFGQQANMSIADFLGSLGNEFNISQGEGKWYKCCLCSGFSLI